MTMQPKAWISHFIVLVQAHQGNLCTFNRHLHILDGHNSHVTMDIMHKALAMGFDLIIVPSHTSHTCTTFRRNIFQTFQNCI